MTGEERKKRGEKSAVIVERLVRVIDRGELAQPIEPPCTDPYARWCGRGQRATAAPMPINVLYDIAGACP